MSLSASVILISKMVFLRLFLLVLTTHTHIIQAGTTPGPHSQFDLLDLTRNFVNEIASVIAEEIQTLPHPEQISYFSPEKMNLTESEPYQAEEPGESPYLLAPVDENKLHGLTEKIIKYATTNEDTGSLSSLNEYPVIKESEPKRIQEILPFLTKDEVPLNYLLKLQKITEQDALTAVTSYLKDSEPFYPVKPVESTSLHSCIDKIQNDIKASSKSKHVLPVQVQEPLPLLGATKPYQTSKEVVQEIHIDKIHEPLPPLEHQIGTSLQQKLEPIQIDHEPVSVQKPIPPIQSQDDKIPIQTIALPITEGTYPSVIASGPFPASVSVLKDVPAVNVAPPLPPLQTAVPTKEGINERISAASSIQLPQGPYPANLPIGHPYPPAI